MSFEISTDKGRVSASAKVRLPTPARATADHGLQPWQFFVLAALACATVVTFLARGQGVVPVVLLGVLMAATAVVGLAALRAVRPLVGAADDRTVMVGDRTRAALEREKMLALRSIKELEFDRAMGKLSDNDWREMSARLRARAARLMRQLDAGGGYREQIEKDLATRLRDADARLKPSRYEEDDDDRGAKALAERDADRNAKALADARSAKALADARSAKASAERTCMACGVANDADARFCKGCGGKL